MHMLCSKADWDERLFMVMLCLCRMRKFCGETSIHCRLYGVFVFNCSRKVRMHALIIRLSSTKPTRNIASEVVLGFQGGSRFKVDFNLRVMLGLGFLWYKV